MKLAVSHDERGEIVTLFDPNQLHGSAGSLTYVPAKGERHHLLDVPKEFEATPFQELPGLLRVNTSSGKPRLERKA